MKGGKLTLSSADWEHHPHYLRKCQPEQLKLKKKKKKGIYPKQYNKYKPRLVTIPGIQNTRLKQC